MTTTNPWAIYDELDVPHLERFLDDGADFVALDLTEEDVSGYANNAAVRWYGPPVIVKGEDAGDVMAQTFFELICKVCVIEEQDVCTFHDDGRVTVATSWGEELEVNEKSMRHWQWLLMVLTREDIANRFLDAVPSRFRVAAMEQARSNDAAEHAQFLEMMFPNPEGED